MLKLLAFLWSGCWHKWKTLGKGHYSRKTIDTGEHSDGVYFILECERCGLHKMEIRL